MLGSVVIDVIESQKQSLSYITSWTGALRAIVVQNQIQKLGALGSTISIHLCFLSLWIVLILGSVILFEALFTSAVLFIELRFWLVFLTD